MPELLNKNSMDPIVIKTAIVGSANTGKTCIVNRITYDQYMEDIPTVAALFSTVSITVNDIKYTIEIDDTAGQEIYRSMVPSFIRGKDIIIIVFDIQSYQSFDDIQSIWAQYLEDYSDKAKFVLVGNKSDLEKCSQITDDEIQRIKDYIGAAVFFYTSAVTGYGIKELFNSFPNILGNDWMTKKMEAFEVIINDDKPEKNCSC